MRKLNRTKRKSKLTKKPSQPPAFTKKKKKVGRKQVAANVTRVDFKTRRIHLPSQLTSHQDSSTHLNTLLSQLRHHNANTRLHALTALQQLAHKDPQLIRHSLSNIINRLEPLFTDSHLLKQIHSFLSLLFSLTPPELISPHIPLLIAYVNVALAHPQSSIQSTALEIGRSLLSFFPREISHHAQRILPKYLALMDSHSISHQLTGRTPTFSQLVTPVISTHSLTLSHTLEQCRLVFENILSTLTLLIRDSSNDVTPPPSTLSHTNSPVAYIPPRGLLSTRKPVELDSGIVSFYSSYIPVGWSQFKELHNSLSKSSLTSERLQGTLKTLSAIIDTYILLPQLVTVKLLNQVECSIAKYHTSQKQPWISEFYNFTDINFPVEATSLSLHRETSHPKPKTDSTNHDALSHLNKRIINLYVSLHTQTKLNLRINSDKVLKYIQTLALSHDDVTALISILQSLRGCKRDSSECECPHLIQGVSTLIWNYLQESGSREEVLDFVLFLLDFYFELTNTDLMLHVDSMLSSLSSLVQDPISNATASCLVKSLSRLYTHSCASSSLISSRGSIILSLLQYLPHCQSQQLQRSIINLAFFSDLDNTEFLDSTYELITCIPIDISLHLLDVLIALSENQSKHSQVLPFLQKLKENSSPSPHSLQSDTSVSPLVMRAVSYLNHQYPSLI